MQRDEDNKDVENQVEECLKQVSEQYRQKWNKEISASGLAKQLFKDVVPTPKSILSGGLAERVGKFVGDLPSWPGFVAGIWTQSAFQFEINVVNTFLESANNWAEAYEHGKQACFGKSYEPRRKSR